MDSLRTRLTSTERERDQLRHKLQLLRHDPVLWLVSGCTSEVQDSGFLHPVTPRLVSVIVPVYNTRKFLEKCVRSVWNQLRTNFEVELLLCDDGSTDGSIDSAAYLAADSPIPMTVLTHPGGINRGVSATRNVAIRSSRGEFIALLDSDDYWEPEKLAEQIAFFDSHPDTNCVCSLAYNRDDSGRSVEGWGGTDIAGYYGQDAFPFELMLESDPVLNSSIVVRRRVLEDVGLYPDTMAHQAEDWLLLQKIALHGPIMLVRKPLLNYTIHPGNYTLRYFSEGLGPSTRLECFYNLLHFLLQRTEYRQTGEAVYRKCFPKLLPAAGRVHTLVQNFIDTHRDQTPEQFEQYLSDLQRQVDWQKMELEQLRKRSAGA